MLASITHRVTGIALAVGTLVLAWWLVSVSNGPEGYESFMAVADTPLGLVVLFGFAWSLAFHLLNGVRHLAWDLGYGFNKVTATQTGSLVYVLSLCNEFSANPLAQGRRPGRVSFRHRPFLAPAHHGGRIGAAGIVVHLCDGGPDRHQ
jgi:succinate dehydrogenase / fumarate reductase cytochrome b subunit